MEQELRFGLDLGRLALLKKRLGPIMVQIDREKSYYMGKFGQISTIFKSY